MLKKIYNWMGSQVNSRYATLILSALFFLEAIFFIPVDPLLILFCIERPQKAFFYAATATVSSTIGGAASYLLGLLSWELIGNRLINFFSMEQAFNKSLVLYQKYEIWAVLIAGFTPIPFKAVTLSAGFCKLAFIPFILCSFIARGARFFLLALAIIFFGKKIKFYINHYFNQLAFLFIMLIFISIWVIK